MDLPSFHKGCSVTPCVGSYHWKGRSRWAAGTVDSATCRCPRGHLVLEDAPQGHSACHSLGFISFLSDLFAPVQQGKQSHFWTLSWALLINPQQIPPRMSLALVGSCVHISPNHRQGRWDYHWSSSAAGVGSASLRLLGCRGEQDIPDQAKDRLVVRVEMGDARSAVSNTHPCTVTKAS